MSEFAEITFRGKTVRLPAFIGSEGEIAFDITSLRKEMGAITLDPGYGNTGSCRSAVTFIDGEEGILRYRGFDIAELAEKSNFLEVAYLLLRGELPLRREYDEFSADVVENMMVHEDLRHFFNAFPKDAHPMAVAGAVVGSLSTFYPEAMNPKNLPEVRHTTRRLLAKLPTIISMSYRHSQGRPMVYPRADLGYVENFLNMLFSSPFREYKQNPDVTRSMDLIFLLHADHEQNCSASTVRMVGSSQANLFASISAGVNALWGPLHGGANQALIEMLRMIRSEGLTGKQFLEQVKNRQSGIRLMGFGHRVYQNYDPRARILKDACFKVLESIGVKNDLLDIALDLERLALADPYFVERKLYPNVDFYSGIILQAIGIPLNMFTAIFAIGRMPGWLAQWREMQEDPDNRIARPRQIYVGSKLRSFVPMEER
jgi:citrate synthase